MGTRSAEEIEREIEYLRVDTDRVLAELESRFRDTLNVRAQAERHPLAVSSVGLALLGVLGITAYTIFARISKPGIEERLGQGMGRGRASASEIALERAGHRPKGRVDMVKRVLWVFLTTILVTLASFAARKLSVTIWSRTMHERPPKK